jgi:hypothetical protein
MDLDLTDEEKTALERELRRIIADARYPLSPRIQTLKAILNKIRPEPIREPLPELKHYDPPRAGWVPPSTVEAALVGDKIRIRRVFDDRLTAYTTAS